MTSYYFSILFSAGLSEQGPQEKTEAIKKLQNYFDTRPDINTGADEYFPASVATAPFLDGTINLAETFSAKVLHAELTENERVDVVRLGFSTSVVGPHAFAFYKNPEPLAP